MRPQIYPSRGNLSLARQIFSFLKGHPLLIVVYHQRSSVIKGHLKDNLRSQSSSIKGHLPSKIVFQEAVFHQRLSAIKGCQYISDPRSNILSHTHIHLHTDSPTHAHTYTPKHLHTHTQTPTHAPTHTHTQAHTHTHIHTCTHTIIPHYPKN